MKTFIFDAHKLFDKPYGAKLRNQKALDEAGQYLQENNTSLAVVTASTAPKGDADKDRLLSEARAMVVRNYLVRNFSVDDSHVKTMGAGKAAEGADGQIEVLVYPPRAAAELASRGHSSNRQ
jgi:outer membrane protein OmpA-like peptidoglycan-associated protein